MSGSLKYKVKFTVYDNDERRHEDREEIVEASSEDEAKEKITSRSSMWFGEYFVNSVEEVRE